MSHAARFLAVTAAQDTVGRIKDDVHDLQGSGGGRPRCEPWRAEIGQLSSCLPGLHWIEALRSCTVCAAVHVPQVV